MLYNSRVYNVLFYQKPAKVILKLSNKDSYTSKLSRECNVCREQIIYIVNSLEQHKLILKLKRSKGKNNLILTDKGKKICYHLNIIMEALEHDIRG